MKELFIELRVQEIPSDTLNTMEQTFCQGVVDALAAANLPHGDAKSGSTPRRLWVSVASLASRQQDRVETITGAPKTIAYNDDGSLSVAGKKFVEKNGISEKDIQIATVQGREVITCTKNIVGAETVTLLPEIFSNAMGAIKAKRSMRWGRHRTEFIRPMEGVVCLFGGEVVPNIHLAQDGIPVASSTLGHRFTHAKTSVSVTGVQSYLEGMGANGVVATYDQRRTMIREALEGLTMANPTPEGVSAKTHHVEIDDDLLHETANLVEYPYPIMGAFHEKFLQLPKGVLTTTMKVHQRFFNTITTADNKISNHFVGISNNPYHHNIQEGYQRVINARLHDALFFYEADTKITMDEMATKLQGVVFMNTLGSIADKVDRIAALAAILTPALGLDTPEATLSRAAHLCKADLTSAMVYEFPELQGYMGEHYANKAGEQPDVALAIREHYLPRFGDDELPTTHTSAVLAIADKVDSICGAFIAGTPPTGNADPLGVRRHAVGVIRILSQMDYTISLHRLISESIETYRTITKVEPLPTTHKKYLGTDDEIANTVLKFFETRLQAMYAQTLPANVIQATFQLNRNIKRDTELAQVLHNLSQTETFALIADSFKRINNILKKSNQNITQNYDAKLFQQNEETDLATALEQLLPTTQKHLANGDYNLSVESVLTIAPTVSAFFDKVMVNHDDNAIRNNRLALLLQLRKLFTTVGNWEAL